MSARIPGPTPPVVPGASAPGGPNPPPGLSAFWSESQPEALPTGDVAKKIDNRLNELGLTYDAAFDYEPKLVNFEGEDQLFSPSMAAPKRQRLRATGPIL